MSLEVSTALDACERAYDRATLRAALDALTAADQAMAAGRVASAQASHATEQLAKARRALEATPIDLITLLVHLTVARTLVTEGWGPPALARCLSAAIARVHHLARTTPEVFR
jgi:hypothetical protein